MPHSRTSASRGASSRPLTIELSLRALAKAEAAGWTHRRLALMIGKSNAYAGKLFAGGGALDLGWSRQLADALGLSLDELFRPAPDEAAEAAAPLGGRTPRQADEAQILRRLASLDDAAHAEAAERVLALLSPPPGDGQAPLPPARADAASGKAGRADEA